MALSNYEELRQAIIDQSHRGDLDLKIDQFILLAETQMRANQDEALKMNLSEQVTTLLTSTVSRLNPLPTGYLKGRDVSISMGNGIGKLTYVTPGDLIIRNGTGAPCFFTIIANQIEFDILPDAEYTVTAKYFGDFTNLSTLNPTNEVLTKYPNLYLYGAMVEVYIFAIEEQLAASYLQLFIGAIRSANATENELRYGPQPTMRTGWAP